MDLNLKGRVAAITGGAAGIGEAIARAFAVEGCKVCVLDRDRDAAQRTASSLAKTGVDTNASVLDVSDPEAVTRAFAQISERFGFPDILVNAAGVLSTGPVADLPVTEWRRVSDVNLAGIIYCMKAVIPAMSRRKAGRIINIASVSAMRGGGSLGNTLYGTTKAGVVALTKGLARELGPDNITVNAIAPAITDTAMTHRLLTQEARTRILARIPLGRMADAADIANLAVFLASERAGFITGATIPVDGGILTT